jgi:hypothetical protein
MALRLSSVSFSSFGGGRIHHNGWPVSIITGGRFGQEYANYAENVLYTQILCLELLEEKNSNYYLLDHGGARRGSAARVDKENNIRVFLAGAFGRKDSSIAAYISQGEFLSEEALKALCKEPNANAKFFEALEKPKYAYALYLQSRDESDDEIEKTVSEWTLHDALPEFIQDKHIERCVNKEWKSADAATKSLSVINLL